MELRRITADEAEDLFALIDSNRSYLREWLPWLDEHCSVEDTVRFLHNISQHFEQQYAFHLGLYVNGQLVGMLSIHHLDWRNRKASLGYWIGSEFQGQGWMTEACKTLMAFCFDDLSLHRLELHCAEHNMSSRKVAERLGFTLEGLMHEVEWLYDHWVDHAVYAILSSNFRSESSCQDAAATLE